MNADTKREMRNAADPYLYGAINGIMDAFKLLMPAATTQNLRDECMRLFNVDAETAEGWIKLATWTRLSLAQLPEGRRFHNV